MHKTYCEQHLLCDIFLSQIFDAVPFSYEQAESLKEYYRNVRRIYIIDSNIYSRCGSIFRDLLSDEIGDTIYIKEIEKYGQEQLLAMVANNDIDYAICD